MEYKGGLKNVTSNDKVKNVMRVGGLGGKRGGVKLGCVVKGCVSVVTMYMVYPRL